METQNIKTSRDLANVLEHIADVLRSVPEIQLMEIPQVSEISRQEEGIETCVSPGKDTAQLTDLATQLPNLSREVAKEEVAVLTVPKIRRLASLLGVRLPSKMTKSESVDTLIAQVFDVPAGQELIRTFHKRNALS